MNRPSLQFYPGDWMRNANLRRCSHAERGVWVDIMCLMHDSEPYGVLQWPLEEIADAVRATLQQLQALIAKGVMKGADVGQTCEAYTYTPRTAGKNGKTVTLINEQPGPLWYSSRMVKDEHVRTVRGNGGGTQASPKVPISGINGDHISEDQSLTYAAEANSRSKGSLPSTTVTTLAMRGKRG